jgi:hypothetical protein
MDAIIHFLLYKTQANLIPKPLILLTYPSYLNVTSIPLPPFVTNSYPICGEYANALPPLLKKPTPAWRAPYMPE